MSAGNKIPLSEAQKQADDIIKKLAPVCSRVDIAGSIRRQVPLVGDIEICAIPRREADMFLYDDHVHPDFMRAVSRIGQIIRGKDRYMKIVPRDGGLPVDLFCPNEWDYWRIFAIRTGSVDYSRQVIAAAWCYAGWQGSDAGLIRRDGGAEKPPVWQSEQEFFDWLGVRWIEPNKRR